MGSDAEVRPSLVEVQADFSSYLNMSKKVRKIYSDYTDQIEAYGIDQCWLNVTYSKIFGNGEQIAEQIRNRVKKEIGLTVSVGVSWNKIFAKLGSDMKKPDAVTAITPENYKEIVWTLPVEDLLYVGKATKNKLNKINIKTIGEFANSDEKLLESLLGKWGEYLYTFANGKDLSPVTVAGEEENVKSIGNSLTVYRDLKNDEDVKMIIYLLADSVTARMRESGMNRIQTVHIFARAADLTSYRKQGRTKRPTGDICEIGELAFRLFKEIYPWRKHVRGIGLSVSDFYFGPEQIDMFGSVEKDAKHRSLDIVIDKLRKKSMDTTLYSLRKYTKTRKFEHSA